MAAGTKRVVILGASGFIGKYLFGKFAQTKGIKTAGFSSKDLDLLSERKLKDKLSGLTSDDILILAAAITRLKENSFSSMLKNIRMIENIAAFIAERPVGQVIYMSTIDVYGIDIKKGVKITENTPLCPHDYYAISKLVGEFLLKRICEHKNIPLVILRLAGIYGPGDKDKSTIDTIVSTACRKKKIHIYGDGRNLRDHVYIDDLYKIIKQAIDNRLNLMVNVATGKSYSISEIANIVKSSLPIDISIDYKPVRFEKYDERARSLTFNCSYLKKNFCGLELLDLKDGIPVYIKNGPRGI